MCWLPSMFSRQRAWLSLFTIGHHVPGSQGHQPLSQYLGPHAHREPGTRPDTGFLQSSSFPAQTPGACHGIRSRLTADRPLPACPAATYGRAALPGPEALCCPFLSRFPQTKIRPCHLTKDLVWFIYGKRRGSKGQVSWAAARLLHRPSDTAMLCPRLLVLM